MTDRQTRKARLSMAGAAGRQRIYEMRHDVYATELSQHKTNTDRLLSDQLDDVNEYIIAEIDGELAGFISITPPGTHTYSIEKYIQRDLLQLSFDDSLYELRILTVAKQHRSSRLAAVLLYAAFRWIEKRNGKHIVAMGRTEIMNIYLKHGAQFLNHQVKSGAVTFELLKADIAQLRKYAESHHSFYTRLASSVIWELDFPFFKAQRCFHGGAFFEAIGTGFASLDRRRSIINADVLDAWFPPSPKVLGALRENLSWLIRTSPPANSDGLRKAISVARCVAIENLMPGAGSSDLIYLAFLKWLTKSSRVLILDPTYGEYAHILEHVIGCQVDRFVLSRSDRYAVDLFELGKKMRQGYDLVVLVNPNNPTGQHISGLRLQQILEDIPLATRVWIDEAYLDYIGPDESLERYAAGSRNLIVCKSMSKVYALSGVRAAYLCASMQQLAPLFPLIPPWALSLPAQVAAVKALEDPVYYRRRYTETHVLRDGLVAELEAMGIQEIVPGAANFVMFHLGPSHPTPETVLDEARRAGVFLRDVSSMGQHMGGRAIRVAVKNKKSNAVIVETLGNALRQPMRPAFPITSAAVQHAV